MDCREEGRLHRRSRRCSIRDTRACRGPVTCFAFVTLGAMSVKEYRNYIPFLLKFTEVLFLHCPQFTTLSDSEWHNGAPMAHALRWLPCIIEVVRQLSRSRWPPLPKKEATAVSRSSVGCSPTTPYSTHSIPSPQSLRNPQPNQHSGRAQQHLADSDSGITPFTLGCGNQIESVGAQPIKPK